MLDARKTNMITAFAGKKINALLACSQMLVETIQYPLVEIIPREVSDRDETRQKNEQKGITATLPSCSFLVCVRK